MIVCVTPNAAIDRTLIVPGFTTDGVYRPQQTIIDAGGKGINTARAIQILGGEPLCAGFLAGHSGQFIAEQVEADGLRANWTFIESGESRTCVIIVDPDRRTSAVVNERGPMVSEADWKHLRETLLNCTGGASTMCFCGSLPPASPIHRFKELLAAVRDTGCEVWVDTSGEALTIAAAVPGINLKINEAEASVLLHRPIIGQQDAVEAADILHRRSSATVVLTRGGDGAVLVCTAGRWLAASNTVEIISAVGSGDSFFAGLLVALERGDSPPEALRCAVAAGAANAQTAGGARFSLEDFNQMVAQTKLQPLSYS